VAVGEDEDPAVEEAEEDGVTSAEGIVEATSGAGVEAGDEADSVVALATTAPDPTALLESMLTISPHSLRWANSNETKHLAQHASRQELRRRILSIVRFYLRLEHHVNHFALLCRNKAPFSCVNHAKERSTTSIRGLLHNSERYTADLESVLLLFRIRIRLLILRFRDRGGLRDLGGSSLLGDGLGDELVNRRVEDGDGVGQRLPGS